MDATEAPLWLDQSPKEEPMATTETSFSALSLEQAALADGEGDRRYVRLRRDLDIGAFGTNAAYQAKAGEQVIGEHDEIGPGSDRQEELYVVVQGGCTFTVDGEELDAPHGTTIFVRDPAAKRAAVATEDGTIVLAVGGRRGEAYRVPPGATLQEFFRLHAAKDYEGAMSVCQEALAQYPGNALILYNIACLQALLGRPDDALETLGTAVDSWPAYKENAREDDDFASLRDDPRFQELIAA
jgi:tetratricopeptide (TPR) repeat protein